jgi:nitroimidazol reductase NimA-like FMN-containing flavoprotein (pyridoxamine 5'-phosphate oxidase superfamily)
MYGGTLESTPLPWGWAEAHLEAGINFWIATTRPDGRPHVRPVWGVWLDGAFYFSTGSAAIRNLPTNPAISVQLEAGEAVVIIEGRAAELDDRAMLVRAVEAYNVKYHWDMDPDAIPGPFLEVRPDVVYGWLVDGTGRDGGSLFHGTNTKWTF